MKKHKIISAITLSASVLLIGGSSLAAPMNTLNTNGTVNFKEYTGGGSIIEPDPTKDPDQIIKLPSTEGVSGTGSIRIQFVPNFRFGTQDGITASAQERPVELLEMTEADGVTPHGKIAPFVQVTDGRGLSEGESSWTLTATATKFSNVSGDLGDSYISLDGSTLTTSTDDTAKANEMVTGQEAGENKISLDSLKPTTILKTKPGKSTNGYQVSNVFHSTYTKGMSYPEAEAGEGSDHSTNGVKFHKVKDVSPLKDVIYTSTITWTLTDGL